ncbi:MAG TPA: diacylglycerol kinase family protein [Actinocrinis sp.]|nr:diacylglycerol kinase family protein [Actinocrinis sp.]
MTRVALVVNRAETGPAQIEALYRTAAAACVDAGWPAPELLLADETDPGAAAAGQALRDGADLVVACGGDVTVSAVAEALTEAGADARITAEAQARPGNGEQPAGEVEYWHEDGPTDRAGALPNAALGIVPLGIGNLLAASLGVPGGLDEAVNTLITGVDRRIDLGVVRSVDHEQREARVLVGLAGLGFDAAVLADVSAGLRRRIGWPAYLVPIARHLGDRGVTVTFELDGRTVRHRAVRTALIGNVGRVRGGLDLLPDSAPDDGLLDVVVLAPRGRILGWPAVVRELISSRSRNTDDVIRYRAGHIVARTRRPVAQEVDGEVLGSGVCLDVRVLHLALAVRVPRPAPASR